MLLSNFEIALRLSKGERIPADKIRDKKGVILHLGAIERTCVGVARVLKQELHNDQ
jgi:hypothetical protein